MNQLSCAWCSALVLSLCMVSTSICADEAASTKGSDKAAIEALEQKFIAAMNAKDVDAIMRSYAPGADLFVFDVAPPRQHVGWDDYKKDWQDSFAALPGPIKFSISDLTVTVIGSVAYSHSIQGGYMTRKDGSRLNAVVRVTDVYRKVHGHWLVVQEHVSVPVDFETGKADLLSKP